MQQRNQKSESQVEPRESTRRHINEMTGDLNDIVRRFSGYSISEEGEQSYKEKLL